jgi:hypothetical protein
MRKLVLTLTIAAALAVPALAGGTSYAPKPDYPTGPARQGCKTERDDHPELFQSTYANKNGKHAFRRCVRQKVHAAVKGCRAERKDDKDAFREKYGNEKGRNAFRRCVRQNEGSVAMP